MRVATGVVLAVILVSSIHAQDGQPHSIDGLIAALHSPDQHVREEALKSISTLGVTATDALIAALADPQVSRDATVALGRIGPAAAPALTVALTNPDLRIRQGAAVALGRIGGAAAETSVPSLIAALGDPDEYVRAYVGWALGQIGAPASGPLRNIGPAPLAALISNLRVSETRDGVVKALKLLGPTAIPALRGALSNPDPKIRQGAAIGLGEIMAAAPETSVPSLSAALSDSDPGVRQEVVEALGRIGQSGSASSVIAPLTAALGDAEPRVRAWAAIALSWLSSSAANAIPALVAALGDQDEFVRRSSADTLRQIGQPAAPALIAALGDSRAKVRRGAAETLGSIRPPEDQAIPKLIAALEDTEPSVREAAAATLRYLGSAAVPALVSALGNPNPETRRLAAVALQEGPKLSIPALVTALWDPDEKVRHAAASALDNAIRIPYAAATCPCPPWFDPAIVQHTLDLAVGRAIKDLGPGEIVYNPPDRMQVGVSEPITARIARGDFEGDLKRDLVGRGLAFAAKIKVGTFVRVELGGPDFKVDAVGDRDRVLPEGTMQEWRFDVLPLHAGKRRILDLLVSVRIHLPGAAEIPGAFQFPASSSQQMVTTATKEELYSFPSFHREIAVDVSPVMFARNLLADNWQYFLSGLATVATAIAAFFGKRWFEGRATRRDPSSPARTKARRR
jgi:HEAT repeat protein